MKIILNIATHGDERLGFKVAKEIKKFNINKNILRVQIANKKAFKLHKRFIDQDLNRSLPGGKNGNYEERLAYKLSPFIRSADIIIDVHSTTSELKDTIIVTRLDERVLKYLKIIKPKYVLIMTVTENSALISQAKIGIAFEYGKDRSSLATQKTVTGIKRIFKHLGIIDLNIPKSNIVTKYFDVTSAVHKPKGYRLLKKIKNLKIIKKGNIYATNGNDYLTAKEDFYPALFGEKTYKYIFGFSAKKLKINNKKP